MGAVVQFLEPMAYVDPPAWTATMWALTRTRVHGLKHIIHSQKQKRPLTVPTL